MAYMLVLLWKTQPDVVVVSSFHWSTRVGEEMVWLSGAGLGFSFISQEGKNVKYDDTKTLRKRRQMMI